MTTTVQIQKTYGKTNPKEHFNRNFQRKQLHLNRKSNEKAVQLSVFILFIAAFLYGATKASGQNNAVNYARLVDTRLGNAAAGNTFPGATYPFGMVQFTRTYFSRQEGFVINQLSGAGCDHMGNFPVLPLNGGLYISPDNIRELRTDISREKGTAGNYQAIVNHDILAELTVTPRTGLARFSFNGDSSKATIIIGGGIASTPLTASAIAITGKNSLEGYAEGGSFCGVATDYKIYFAAQFDQEAIVCGTWKGERLSEGNSFVEGQNTGAYFTFDLGKVPEKRRQVQYKIAISYVSVANAKANLAQENTGWDFDLVKTHTENEWNRYLSKIEVRQDKGTKDDPSRISQFYTHLYHSFIHPNICSDINGEYMGADNKVHQSSRPVYTSFSNWDTYRTQIQLLSMLVPAKASDMVASLGNFAEQAGGGMPRWVLANRETGIMQGDPSSILVANAYAFGARNFDARKLLQIMVHGATDSTANAQGYLTRPGLKQLLEKGYYDASIQLEYNSADFAISRLALMSTDDQYQSAVFQGRAQSWKNLFNPARNWLQSKNPDGSWKRYDADWRESTYKNYFWMVPFNLKGLIDKIGGKKAAEKRLDSLFVRIDANYGQEWFASGNEPSFGIPWVYNWAGTPYKTQAVVHRIIKNAYHDGPDGLPGNDDLGAMGAYYVFCSIGLYPEIPGVGGFAVNSPFYADIKIHLPDGLLEIKGGSSDKPYIHHLKINGKPYNSTWIPLDSLTGNTQLSFDLGSKPDKNWGVNGHPIPPSFD